MKKKFFFFFFTRENASLNACYFWQVLSFFSSPTVRQWKSVVKGGDIFGYTLDSPGPTLVLEENVENGGFQGSLVLDFKEVVLESGWGRNYFFFCRVLSRDRIFQVEWFDPWSPLGEKKINFACKSMKFFFSPSYLRLTADSTMERAGSQDYRA